METLPYTGLHSEATVLRALSRAGQFAHLDRAVIRSALEELYDPFFRERIEGAPVEAYAQNAVDRDLVALRSEGRLTEPVYKATVAWWIAETLGVTCCLCLDVGTGQAELLDEGFATFFCPTYLRTGNPERRSAKGPLPFCGKCGRALANWMWREGGFRNAGRPAPQEYLFAAASWLVTNRTFRDRVQENAHRLAELRFDPRGTRTWGKRSIASRTRTCESCGGRRSITAKTCRECFRKLAPAAAQARWNERRAA